MAVKDTTIVWFEKFESTDPVYNFYKFDHSHCHHFPSFPDSHLAEPHTHIGKNRKPMNWISHAYLAWQYCSWTCTHDEDDDDDDGVVQDCGHTPAKRLTERYWQPWFMAYFFDIGHPVKTRYPLASIWQNKVWWDRTAQTCSLTSILLDPYYRTIHGFQVCSDYHKFWRNLESVLFKLLRLTSFNFLGNSPKRCHAYQSMLCHFTDLKKLWCLFLFKGFDWERVAYIWTQVHWQVKCFAPWNIHTVPLPLNCMMLAAVNLTLHIF